jgi:hypothetical protein
MTKRRRMKKKKKKKKEKNDKKGKSSVKYKNIEKFRILGPSQVKSLRVRSGRQAGRQVGLGESGQVQSAKTLAYQIRWV